MTSAPVTYPAPGSPKIQLRSLISDTLSVGGLSVVARLAGGIKTVAGAWYFRPGPELDAYLLAFLIPSFLGDVLAGSIGLALIPALNEEGEQQIYGEALHRAIQWLGLITLAAAVVAFFAPSGIGPRWQTARPMLLVMLPLLPLMGVNAVWRSVLHARLHFRAAALAPLLTPIVTVACLPFAPHLGAMALALGTTLGMFGETAFLASALGRLGISRFPRRSGTMNLRSTRMIGQMKRQYAALIAGSVMWRGSAAVDQAAATLLGTGALSLLNYGTRLSSVLLAIGPAAIGTTVMPRYAQAIAAGRRSELRHALIAKLAAVGAMAALIVAALVWGSEPLTRIVLLRGAFTSSDVHQVSQVQIFSLLQLPFAAALAILSGLVASLKANHSMLPLWGIALALHIALDFWFFKPMGVRGIALSTTVVQGFLVVTLFALVLHLVRKSD